MDTYDVAVLGGGPGGTAAATCASRHGRRTCIIEAGRLGGVCLNTGCIPTKAMLHAGELYWTISHRAAEFGLSVENPSVDARAFMKRVADVVSTVRKGMASKFNASDVDVFRGRGRLVSPETISIKLNDGGRRQIRAANVVIATGSSPSRPDIFPWSSPRVMTTDEATTAETLPQSVLIVGAGVIGCEFATVYAELGIPTTVIEMLDRLCANLDVDCSRAIARSLKQRGAEVHTGARITHFRADDDCVAARMEDGTELKAESALIAVGRKPNVEDIGLEAAGVAVRDGVIAVDDRCRTSAANVYAVGDVAERRQYAHVASRMGHVAARNACGFDVTDDRAVVPVGQFAHPEVASVGLTEAQAREQFPNARVGKLQYRATGAGWAYGQTEGAVKLIADSETGEILGGTVVGRYATEVLQELTTAMKNHLTVEQIFQSIHIHPTFVEGVALAAEDWLFGRRGK